MYSDGQSQFYQPGQQLQNYPQSQPGDIPISSASRLASHPTPGLPNPIPKAQQPYNQVPVGHQISGPTPQAVLSNPPSPKQVSDQTNTVTQPLLPGPNTDI